MWSAPRLVLKAPLTIPKPGVEPPIGPSPSPFPRYGYALPATGTQAGELFLFGGLVRETPRNDLYRFSTRGLMRATLLETGGDIPSPRVGHASVLASRVLIVWGGDTKTDPKSEPTSQDDGLYLLNLGVYSIFLVLFRVVIANIWEMQFLESGLVCLCMDHPR